MSIERPTRYTGSTCTATCIWDQCDGSRSPKEIAGRRRLDVRWHSRPGARETHSGHSVTCNASACFPSRVRLTGAAPAGSAYLTPGSCRSWRGTARHGTGADEGDSFASIISSRALAARREQGRSASERSRQAGVPKPRRGRGRGRHAGVDLRAPGEPRAGADAAGARPALPRLVVAGARRSQAARLHLCDIRFTRNQAQSLRCATGSSATASRSAASAAATARTPRPTGSASA